MSHVEIAYSIPGQTWPRELSWLSSAFSKSGVHIEIGVYCGRSFYVSCMGLPIGARAIAVDDDSHPNAGTGFPHPCKEWVSTIRGMTLKSIKDARPDLKVELLPMSGLFAANKLIREINKSDVVSVFIDGTHTYESVSADIEAWKPFIRTHGSILCGHDYWSANYPVIDAVEDTLGKGEHSDLGPVSVVANTRIWHCQLGRKQ